MRSLSRISKVNIYSTVFLMIFICRFSQLPSADERQLFSYENYAALLQEYVNAEGRVNYKGLKADRIALDDFAASLATLPRSVYEGFSDKEKIAFWINAYNALTLHVVTDRYPIKAGWVGALRYPQNSIRQIDGVWDTLTFKVMDEALTLDRIEHNILRKQFSEPRIHLALVCASIGCPYLRQEPYDGEKLDHQLDDQARRFLSTERYFRIDRDRAVVYCSSIFKWYGEDFVERYGSSNGFPGLNDTDRAVLNFIASYLDSDDTAYLRNNRFSLRYLEYDWSLNDTE